MNTTKKERNNIMWCVKTTSAAYTTVATDFLSRILKDVEAAQRPERTECGFPEKSTYCDGDSDEQQTLPHQSDAVREVVREMREEVGDMDGNEIPCASVCGWADRLESAAQPSGDACPECHRKGDHKLSCDTGALRAEVQRLRKERDAANDRVCPDCGELHLVSGAGSYVSSYCACTPAHDAPQSKPEEPPSNDIKSRPNRPRVYFLRPPGSVCDWALNNVRSGPALRGAWLNRDTAAELAKERGLVVDSFSILDDDGHKLSCYTGVMQAEVERLHKRLDAAQEAASAAKTDAQDEIEELREARDAAVREEEKAKLKYAITLAAAKAREKELEARAEEAEERAAKAEARRDLAIEQADMWRVNATYGWDHATTEKARAEKAEKALDKALRANDSIKWLETGRRANWKGLELTVGEGFLGWYWSVRAPRGPASIVDVASGRECASPEIARRAAEAAARKYMEDKNEIRSKSCRR